MVKDILPFQFHAGLEPESHTRNYQRYWLQLAQSEATAITQSDTQVDYTPLVFYHCHYRFPYMSKKMMPTFRTLIQNVFGVQLHRKSEASYENRKVSSEEHWVHTHVSYQNAVQLRLQIFWSCIFVFWSCVYNGKAAQ